MDADLVVRPVLGTQLEPWRDRWRAEDFVVGTGGLTRRVGDHAPTGLARDLAQRQFEAALRGGGSADDDRPIHLLDAAG